MPFASFILYRASSTIDGLLGATRALKAAAIVEVAVIIILNQNLAAILAGRAVSSI